MGFNTNTLTSILFGIGAGVIIVSCLTVTVCFGEYANSFTSLDKYIYKINFASSLIDTSIVICVFGCLASIATLAALVIYFILDNKIILLIVQFAPVVFLFGCLVSEGVFTMKATDKEASQKFKEYKHDKAQKYIYESIKELYKQGLSNLLNEHTELQNEEIFKWERVSSEFSTSHLQPPYPDLRLNEIWNENPDKEQHGPYGKFINLYLSQSDGFIYACYNNKKSIVASTRFLYKFSYTPKAKFCWYDSETSLKCKRFKTKKITEDLFMTLSDQSCDDYYPLLEEKVVGFGQTFAFHYGEDYIIHDFPVAYHILTYGEIQDEKDKADDERPINLAFEDSTNHFKVKGKSWGKSYGNYLKKYMKDQENFIITPKEPTSLENAITQCEQYYEIQERDEREPDPNYCQIDNDEGTSFSDIKDYLRSKYVDYNLGKEVPYIKKHYKKEARKTLNNQIKTPGGYQYLYTIAIINLIVQIVGFLFLAGSAVLGFILGGSGGDNSEKEGAA